ncbi:septum formation inhibitor Maf [uncultured Tenacibaculum sp.]|uniref:septum formation inhibitor Maf n=1 Tax=uncultured Tenacibaculum sp. TaxID=174713 RepID=UPI0026171277|nr:septum formation inhibitor Maf [uncultured Tenacibaculum sp.]
MKKLIIITTLFISFLSLNSCLHSNASERKELIKNENNSNRIVSKETKEYWYDGNAEISSYKLSQARYGENHDGTATLIFVTEPFSKASNTKADYPNQNNIPVLKLNMNKKFNTGFYPYSMMNSTFFPFEKENTSLKIASSMQEWCGMTYVDMKNNKDHFSFNFNSYFEGASFQNKKIEKTILEDDLWSLIRLNPELLPTGKLEIIPSLFFLNLKHKPFKSYTGEATLEKTESTTVYKITYQKINRSLQINFESSFPYKILSWEESHNSGYGKNKKTLTTKALLMKTIKVDYWNKNSTKDSIWRNKLDLQ